MTVKLSKFKKIDKYLKNVLDEIPLQIWIAEADGRISYVNSKITDYFGVTRKKILGIGWNSMIHPDDVKHVYHSWSKALAKGNAESIYFRLKRKDGKYFWHVGNAMASYDKNGNVHEWFGTNTYVGDREKDIQQLRRLSKLLEESQQIAKLGGWELDVITGELFWTNETYRIHDTCPEEFSPTVDAGVGYFLPKSRELISNALDAAINTGENYDLELETYTTKGRLIDVRTTCRTTQKNGKTVKLTGIFQDITDQKAILKKIEKTNQRLAYLNHELGYIAQHDSLTRLPNRILLADRLNQAMIANKRSGKSIAVAFLDLDGFKDINDSLGHQAGDYVLVHLSEQLRLAMRESDTLARVGGDEFVIVLSELNNIKDCEALLEYFLTIVAQPIEWEGNLVRVSASIGVTMYPQDDLDAEQLIRHADQTMYLAKQAGKNCIHYFDVDQDTMTKSMFEEKDSIQLALEQEQFELYYQPKIKLRDGQFFGLECLIRWNHPVKGVLNPERFLPIIENDPLNIKIGDWVLKTAMKQLDIWHKMGVEIPVSVNVSALQLRHLDFMSYLVELLNLYPQIKPSNLELEILETSALLDTSFITKVINACKELGIRFSIDDFGTGYSSLTYLKQLPVEFLKIDKSFIGDMLDDKEDLVIVKGIISLAKEFGLTTIAEGVESIEHAKVLFTNGCDLAQGFGIARPMKSEKIPEWISQWNSDNTWKNLSKEGK